MTIGDSVRIMDDETLAKMFTDIVIKCGNRLLAVYGLTENCEERREEVFKEWLDLMKKEVPNHA